MNFPSRPQKMSSPGLQGPHTVRPDGMPPAALPGQGDPPSSKCSPWTSTARPCGQFRLLAPAHLLWLWVPGHSAGPWRPSPPLVQLQPLTYLPHPRWTHLIGPAPTKCSAEAAPSPGWSYASSSPHQAHRLHHPPCPSPGFPPRPASPAQHHCTSQTTEPPSTWGHGLELRAPTHVHTAAGPSQWGPPEAQTSQNEWKACRAPGMGPTSSSHPPPRQRHPKAPQLLSIALSCPSASYQQGDDTPRLKHLPF